MKYRQGFVSNSSSSSFVVLGYAFDEDFLEDLDDIIDEIQEHFVFLNSGDDDVPKGKIVLGFNLFEFDEFGTCTTCSYSLQEITDKVIELKLKLKYHLDLDLEELKEPTVFGGTRSC